MTNALAVKQWIQEVLVLTCFMTAFVIGFWAKDYLAGMYFLLLGIALRGGTKTR